MALRQAASYTASALGLRAGAPLVLADSSAPLRTLLARAFSSVPDGLKYDKTHEYVKVDGSIATIGITDHAQAELGDIVYVELPEVGETLGKGDTYGVVESVKASSDIYCPVGGEVTEVNTAATDDPSKVNSEPYEGGWLIKVKMADSSKELSDLMDAAAYKSFIES